MTTNSVSPTVDTDLEETKRVEGWRLWTLLEAGYSADVAERIARRPEIDLHQAVDLLRRGCPADIAGRILT